MILFIKSYWQLILTYFEHALAYAYILKEGVASSSWTTHFHLPNLRMWPSLSYLPNKWSSTTAPFFLGYTYRIHIQLANEMTAENFAASWSSWQTQKEICADSNASSWYFESAKRRRCLTLHPFLPKLLPKHPTATKIAYVVTSHHFLFIRLLNFALHVGHLLIATRKKI